MSGRQAIRFLPFLQPTQATQAASGLQALGVGCSRLWLGQRCRTFASETDDASALSKPISSTHAILQQTRVFKLRQDLEDEAEETLHIPYKRLLDMAKSSGAALDDGEAEEVSTALHRAGVVLRHNDKVFLRPREIADMVMQILPGGREDASLKLQSIEAELSTLEKVHQEVDSQAQRTTTRFLVAGYAIIFTQLVSFIYLTWWELSWDVMEPIGYMISLFYTLVGYTYFLATKGNIFDLGPFKAFWHESIKRKKATAVQFDEERYRYLVQMKDRYRRHLAHAALRR